MLCKAIRGPWVFGNQLLPSCNVFVTSLIKVRRVLATSVYEKLAVNQKFQIRYLILINCMVQIPKKLSLKKINDGNYLYKFNFI